MNNAGRECVSPDMLFRGLFIASSPKFYFENRDWYMEWLTVGITKYTYTVRHAGIQEFPNLNLRSKGGTYK